MDHEQIDKFDLIDRYLMGKLPPAESAVFEEHFVDCPQCVARLQTAKNFMQDMRFFAAEQALQIDRPQPRSASRHFLQPLFNRPVALALGCLLIAAAAGAVFVIEYTRRARAEVSQEKSLAEEWRRRYEDERQSALSAERKRQEAELQQTEQLRALEAKLKDQEAQRAKEAAESTLPMRPGGSLSIFILSSTRSSEQNNSEAVNKITLPRSPAMFAFSIGLEGDTGFGRYRITIFDDRHRLIWRSDGLTPDRHDSLSVLLNSGLFRPGHYSLTVEGVKKGGGGNVVGNYPFLIIKSP
jgi:Putative zinc-finger